MVLGTNLDAQRMPSSLFLFEPVCFNISVAEVDSSVFDPASKDHAITIKTAGIVTLSVHVFKSYLPQAILVFADRNEVEHDVRTCGSPL